MYTVHIQYRQGTELVQVAVNGRPLATNDLHLAEWLFVGAANDLNVDLVELRYYDRLVRRNSKLLNGK